VALEVFVVNPPGVADAALAAIEGHAKSARLAPRRFAQAADAVAALRAAPSSDPAAIVIGPGVESPLAAARAVRAAWQGQLVFAPLREQLQEARRQLALAPMIGENWSLCVAGEAELARMLGDAVRAKAQREQLRTTLDRANLRIRARDSVDAARYRALVLSDRYFAAVMAHAPDPIVAVDARDCVSAWNRGAAELFGRAADEALGLPVAQIAGWPAALGEALGRVRRAAQSLPVKVVLAGPQGERHYRASVSAVRDEGGGYIGAAIVMHDVSAAERALAAEQAARAQAEQMSRMKDEFLATLSHELRTPLSAVLSWAQVLQMRATDPEVRQGVEVIQRNARMQAQLIDDLLDLSRIITGHPFLDLQPVSMVEVAERAVLVVAAAAAAKQIAIEKAYERDIPPLEGDGKRLQQVLWNLLANAVKFTPNGGRVAIAVRRAASRVEITVSDAGQGIEADFLPHLFERFRQSDASIRRRHGGLGLGLAIAKQLVELHGGTIGASSPGLGRGATFTVRLPIAALAKASARPAQEREPPGDPQALPIAAGALDGLRVLVVEDEADSRAALERILRNWGAETASAASADAALECLAQFEPHVLVSDIGMPGRDGYDLLRTIRQRGCGADVLPAIALTAYARQEDVRQALEAGFQRHLAKPAEAPRLVAAVLELARELPSPEPTRPRSRGEA
jgi:PAS domain S-box-containing protein